MRKIFKIHEMALLAFASLLTSFAHAGCGLIPQTVRTGLMTLAVDPRIEIGQELVVRTNGDLVGKTLTTICSGSTNYRSLSLLTASTTVPGAYETGIAGVGVIFSDLWSGPSRNIPYTTNISPNPITAWKVTENLRFTFVKTGPINTGGSIGNTLVARFTLDSSSVADVYFAGLKVIQKSCLVSLNSRSQTVDLGSPRRSEFNGPGSSAASSERNFNIELECQNDNIPIQISFDPVGTTPGNGMINIPTETGAATGVVVEVLDSNRTPIKFATPTMYHSAGELNVSIPMFARYKQTGNNITPGTANAAMTFTITQN
ncbi:type 1 fimbria pilin [Serratia fonticola]|jgi:major type 1 subunit fimbrin (pilin)|uniref:Type 1 fimbria pilin n=1 Tax=Serratia fonticola TaxID=47917 RepID=A0A559T420_SERFO|nr:fimbrial protein [Serratia fonticola]TQI78153.1 type 1 fimbria pilin [Serratia fonticola]TQI94849.1 type 1 fimbria pilin [Serratia fonticola]TVZ69347.1 type 1 fimbria pilin [Serratia fonticola]